jgi:hypothetical protein
MKKVQLALFLHAKSHQVIESQVSFDLAIYVKNIFGYIGNPGQGYDNGI